MSKTIRITVPRDPARGVKVEVDGVTGESCTSLTAKIEQALGSPGQRELTEEYYHVETQQEHNQELA